MLEVDFSREKLPDHEPPTLYPVCESLMDGYDTLGAGVGDPEDFPARSASGEEAAGLGQ